VFYPIQYDASTVANKYPRGNELRAVTFAKPFAVGSYTVTFEEWDACLADGGCGGYRPDDAGWGRGRRPVINVTWDDAQLFTAWLAKKTGKPYRLPSEAEFEYAGRGGTQSRFWWGHYIPPGAANCYRCGSAFDNRHTAPVGSFTPNAFGVYDTVGNVTQWVADRWHPNFEGAPSDGSVWSGGDPRRVTMRSGSWFNPSDSNESSYRNGRPSHPQPENRF
jgi:formylglycine-generating enzyme required for sulfatase activity